MHKEAYNLAKGRPRPPYKPKDIHCSGCGAGLTVKDERAELIVCDYCGSHLEVTRVEQKVLGKGSGAKQNFPLALGDSFRYRASRFEIIARMAFIEDGDIAEMTRQYLLYNPRTGTLWIDEYGGHYWLSKATHVMPQTDPFQKKRGDLLETYDGGQWVTEETGMYELVYVDGALPWVAKIGDRIAYADFTEKSGSGKQYQAQRIKNEVEYSSGRTLDIELVRRATGKRDLGRAEAPQKLIDAAVKRSFYLSVIKIAAIALVINLVLLGFFWTQGKSVLSEFFSAEELNGEVWSKPFNIEHNVIKVVGRSHPGLDNAWMAVDIAIAGEAETILHVFDEDLSYYHGYEGGEKWSEGSSSEATYIRVPQPGTYRLLLHAVSARGNKTRSTKALHGLVVQVIDGARMPHFFIGAIVVAFLILVLTTVVYTKWKTEEDD